jgi:hypothetical protein
MNASENPFSTGRVERLLAFDPSLIGCSWELIEARWAALDRRACVTGHHGAGKTSFLDAMARRLAPTGRVERLFFNDRRQVLSSEDHSLLEACNDAVLLIDGDEYLSWSERRKVMRKSLAARGCLFARYRTGKLPELLKLSSSRELAEALLARISPEWGKSLEEDLGRRLEKQRGNLRELWLEYYDLAAIKGL